MSKCFYSDIKYSNGYVSKERDWRLTIGCAYRKHNMPWRERVWMKTRSVIFKNDGGEFLYMPHTIFNDELIKDYIVKNNHRGIVCKKIFTKSFYRDGRLMSIHEK